MADSWEHKTSSFLSEMGWTPEDCSLLVAVSGGADSVALLHWACRVAPRLNCRVAAAHVNHGLRPSAREEQDFVVSLCREFGIACHQRALTPETRQPRESIEMWGRRERYAFFAEAAGMAGADWVLTGHHRDDLVETVFQRLGRGTGPRGLGGIPFLRDNIVRPFLNRGRAEILEYVRFQGLA